MNRVRGDSILRFAQLSALSWVGTGWPASIIRGLAAMDEGGATNLIIVCVAIALAAAIPALLPRLPIPGAVLEILLGVIIGPQVLGWAGPDSILHFLVRIRCRHLVPHGGFRDEPDGAARPTDPQRGGRLGALRGDRALRRLRPRQCRSRAIGRSHGAGPDHDVDRLAPSRITTSLLGTPYGPMVLAAGALGEGAPLFILPLVLAHQGGAGPQALVMVAFAASAAVTIAIASRVSRAPSRASWSEPWGRRGNCRCASRSAC